MLKCDLYEITKKRDLSYEFITSNNITYYVSFHFNEEYFPNFPERCPTCGDILELIIEASTASPPYDKMVGQTIFHILEAILSNSCNGIMYRCRDDDGKGCVRERKFNSWYDEFSDLDNIDKWVNDFSGGEGIQGKTYLLIDKGCLNYEQVVHDFNYECDECKRNNQSN